MAKLQNLWPYGPCNEKYVSDRRASDDKYMRDNGIMADSHVEHDFGLIDGFYVSEWRLRVAI